MGRKLGLATFYFGLIRFVCVYLLVTAKLNNNNTEFHWVGGGLHTHNVVKPTLLVKVELGFDNLTICGVNQDPLEYDLHENADCRRTVCPTAKIFIVLESYLASPTFVSKHPHHNTERFSRYGPLKSASNVQISLFHKQC